MFGRGQGDTKTKGLQAKYGRFWKGVIIVDIKAVPAVRAEQDDAIFWLKSPNALEEAEIKKGQLLMCMSGEDFDSGHVVVVQYIRKNLVDFEIKYREDCDEGDVALARVIQIH